MFEAAGVKGLSSQTVIRPAPETTPADLKRVDQFLAETAKERERLANLRTQVDQIQDSVKERLKKRETRSSMSAELERLKSLRKEQFQVESKISESKRTHLKNLSDPQLIEFAQRLQKPNSKGQYLEGMSSYGKIYFYHEASESSLHIYADFASLRVFPRTHTKEVFVINSVTCEATPEWQKLCRTTVSTSQSASSTHQATRVKPSPRNQPQAYGSRPTPSRHSSRDPLAAFCQTFVASDVTTPAAPATPASGKGVR